MILLVSCQGEVNNQRRYERHRIERLEGDRVWDLGEPELCELPSYVWDERYCGPYPRITQEFFRCRGSRLNPPRCEIKGSGESVEYTDCGGLAQHGLPLLDGEEFVYPALMMILNRLQEELEKRVVITCGHCCPQHSSYVESSPSNRVSKHMIAAEVDFYVEGLEEEPERVIEQILAMYPHSWQRYQRAETNVRVAPWFNDEVFVKLYQRDEGRDFDNRHSHPYIGVQVRRHKGVRVSYTWEAANRYHRR